MHELYEKEPFKSIKKRIDEQFRADCFYISFPNFMDMSQKHLMRWGIFSSKGRGLADDIDIEQHWKGHFGEIFTILSLSKFPLKRPWNVSDADKKSLNIPFNVWYNWGGSKSPDYLIENTNCFIEVKTGEKAELKQGQREMFRVFLDNGYKVFLIKPNIFCEQIRQISPITLSNFTEKMEKLSKFEWITIKLNKLNCYELMKNNDKLKYEKITFEEMKKEIVEELKK